MFELRIYTGNDSFHGDAALELARLLREIADNLDTMTLAPESHTIHERQVYDENGNRCGGWTYERAADEIA